MEGIVLFGVGDAAALACHYFETDSPHRVAAFAVDAAYLREPVFMDRPVVAFEQVTQAFPPERFGFFVAMGYSKLNRLRAERVAAVRALGYQLVSYVSSRAVTPTDLSHGDNCFILEGCIIQPFVTIGHNVTLWSGSLVAHHSVIEDDVFLAPRVAVSGRSRIGRGSFVGINATIRDHVTVGPECVIGAGALVMEDQAEQGLLAPAGTPRSAVSQARLRRG